MFTHFSHAAHCAEQATVSDLYVCACASILRLVQVPLRRHVAVQCGELAGMRNPRCLFNELMLTYNQGTLTSTRRTARSLEVRGKIRTRHEKDSRIQKGGPKGMPAQHRGGLPGKSSHVPHTSGLQAYFAELESCCRSLLQEMHPPSHNWAYCIGGTIFAQAIQFGTLKPPLQTISGLGDTPASHHKMA